MKNIQALPLFALLPLTISADTCSTNNRPTQPLLTYTISPNFIWFPGTTNAAAIINTFLRSSPAFTSTSPSTGDSTPIRTRIPNFLHTPCAVDLTAAAPAGSSVYEALALLNHTLAATDLVCRLATHKLGRTYTEDAHTMLSMRVRAEVRAPAPKLPIRGVARRDVPPLEDVAPTAMLEYRIDCPASTGPVVEGEQAEEKIEGLKGLAKVRDCDWCKRAASELLGMCKGGNAEMKILGDFVGGRGWGIGGASCDGCT
jgi:hypothetical protein